MKRTRPSRPLDHQSRPPASAGELRRSPAAAAVDRKKWTKDRVRLPAKERGLEPSRERYSDRASDANFRRFVELGPDAVVVVARDGRIVLVNSQTERLFGYPRAELLGQPLELLMPGRFRRRHRGHRRDFFSQPRTRPMGTGLELFGRRRDGSEFPVEISLSPLETEAGILVCGAIRDITDRKRAEEALRQSEARLQAILDNSPALIFLKDTHGRYLHCSRHFEKAFGLKPGRAVGKTDADLFSPKQAAAFRANDRQVIESGAPMQFDEVAEHPDGAHVSIVTKFPLLDGNGRVYAVGGVVTDITERRRLEAEVLQVSEREQRRIAQDLHDGLGQQLAGISCLAGVLRRNLADRGAREAGTAARISQLLDRTVSQTRGLARGLYSVVAEPGGLMTALEDLANNITELSKVACRFKCPRPVLIEDNAVATHLYRIAQEAVANAVRHGRPRKIEIGLFSPPGRLVLTVKNDGVDFRTSTRPRKGLGLRIMKHRAATIGGTLEIRRRAAGDIEVICLAPDPALSVQPPHHGQASPTTKRAQADLHR